MVTILSERGAPTPVVWTRLVPRRSLMAAVEPDAVDRAARDSSLWPKYAEEIDRESAREKLAARMAEAQAAAPTEPAAARPAPEQAAAAPRATKKKDDDNAVLGYLKSREGRSMMNTVARGVFGLLRKRR